MANSPSGGYSLNVQLQLQAPTNNNVQAVLRSLQRQLSGITVPVRVQAASQAVSAINNVASATANVATATGNATTATNNWARSTRTLSASASMAFQNFTTYLISGAIVTSIYKAVSATAKLNDELIKTQQITGQLASSEPLFEAGAIGVDVNALAAVQTTLAQTGKSAEFTAGALEAIAQASLGPTFNNITDLTEGVIAISGQFSSEFENDAEAIRFVREELGKLTIVSKNFAVEASDIVEAVRRAGGTFAAYEKNTDSLIAAQTTLRASTRESASALATSLKTIETRLTDSRVAELFQNNFGVATRANGQFRGLEAIVNDLASAFRNLDTNSARVQNTLREALGLRQVSRFQSLINNADTFNSVLRETRAVAGDAFGEIERDAELASTTIQSAFTRISNSITESIERIGANGSLERLLEVVENFGSNIGPALEQLAPILSAAAGGAAALGVLKITGSPLAGLGAGLTALTLANTDLNSTIGDLSFKLGVYAIGLGVFVSQIAKLGTFLAAAPTAAGQAAGTWLLGALSNPITAVVAALGAAGIAMYALQRSIDRQNQQRIKEAQNEIENQLTRGDVEDAVSAVIAKQNLVVEVNAREILRQELPIEAGLTERDRAGSQTERFFLNERRQEIQESRQLVESIVRTDVALRALGDNLEDLDVTAITSITDSLGREFASIKEGLEELPDGPARPETQVLRDQALAIRDRAVTTFEQIQQQLISQATEIAENLRPEDFARLSETAGTELNSIIRGIRGFNQALQRANPDDAARIAAEGQQALDAIQASTIRPIENPFLAAQRQLSAEIDRINTTFGDLNSAIASRGFVLTNRLTDFTNAIDVREFARRLNAEPLGRAVNRFNAEVDAAFNDIQNRNLLDRFVPTDAADDLGLVGPVREIFIRELEEATKGQAEITKEILREVLSNLPIGIEAEQAEKALQALAGDAQAVSRELNSLSDAVVNSYRQELKARQKLTDAINRGEERIARARGEDFEPNVPNLDLNAARNQLLAANNAVAAIEQIEKRRGFLVEAEIEQMRNQKIAAADAEAGLQALGRALDRRASFIEEQINRERNNREGLLGIARDFAFGDQQQRFNINAGLAGVQNAIQTGTLRGQNDQQRQLTLQMLDRLADIQLPAAGGMTGREVANRLAVNDLGLGGLDQPGQREQELQRQLEQTVRDQIEVEKILTEATIQATNNQIKALNDNTAALRARPVAPPGFASGGVIRGGGTSTSDSIPAMLSDGEFVINAKSARQLGYNNLNLMNQGKKPRYAASGGIAAHGPASITSNNEAFETWMNPDGLAIPVAWRRTAGASAMRHQGISEREAKLRYMMPMGEGYGESPLHGGESDVPRYPDTRARDARTQATINQQNRRNEGRERLGLNARREAYQQQQQQRREFYSTEEGRIAMGRQGQMAAAQTQNRYNSRAASFNNSIAQSQMAFRQQAARYAGALQGAGGGVLTGGSGRNLFASVGRGITVSQQNANQQNAVANNAAGGQTMNHNHNHTISGMISVGGISSQAIAQAVTQHVEGLVINTVDRMMRQNRGFQAGT